MPTEITYAFSSGVLSPDFYGRADLEKYQLGLAQGTNWVIDFRGAARTRPSFEFLDYSLADETNFRLWPFEFNKLQGNTYALLFTNQKLFFLQDGVYLTEAAAAVTSISLANPAVISQAGHPFSIGDLVQFTQTGDWDEFASYTYEVISTTAGTYTVKDPAGNVLDTSSLGATYGTVTAKRVYSIATPYASDELDQLVFDQFRDEVYITHVNHDPRKLIRAGATSWSLNIADFSGYTEFPLNTNATAASGTSGAIYAVAPVNYDDQEGQVGFLFALNNAVNITSTPGQVEVTWDKLDGAKYYRIYRSLYLYSSTALTRAQDLGYIGKSYGTAFIDTNITSDFTQTPRVVNNPFADGAVLEIEITAGGSGWGVHNTTVSISDGSDFRGFPIVSRTGAITGVRIMNPGTGYLDTSTVTFSGSGSGATATVRVSPSSGNNPRCTAIFQSRRAFAGTTNLPTSLFLTRPGLYEDLNVSDLGADDDSIEVALAMPQLTPIKSMIQSPIGLFLFGDNNVYQVRASNDGVVTVSTIVAEPRTSIGANDVNPLRIGDNVIYVRNESLGVNALRPSDAAYSYSIFDVGLYSSHYFEPDNPILAWTYQESTARTVWAVRQDGTLLSLAYIPEQNVYAWSDHYTRGEVKAVAAVREGVYDYVYLVVRRPRGNGFINTVERMEIVNIKTPEDLPAMDSSLATTLPTVAETLSITMSGDTATMVAGAAVFSAGDVGKHIRAAGGLFEITTYTSSTEVEAFAILAPSKKIPGSDLIPVQEADSWSLASRVSTVSGLWHLEGETVQIVGDGSVFPEQVVAGGAVSLPPGALASRITVGLRYDATLQTLPLISGEGLVQDEHTNIDSIGLRLYKARGLSAKVTGGNEYPLKERTSENYGEPTRLQEGVKLVTLRGGWDYNSSVTVIKNQPLHASVQNLFINFSSEDN